MLDIIRPTFEHVLTALVAFAMVAEADSCPVPLRCDKQIVRFHRDERREVSMFRRTLQNMALAAGVIGLMLAGSAEASSMDGAGIEISEPIITSGGIAVSVSLTNTTLAPATVDLEYVRAIRGSLAAGVAGVPFIESVCLSSGILIAPGETVGPFTIVPSAPGRFCHGFVTHVAAASACTGAELGCRAKSNIRVFGDPAPVGPAGGSRGGSVVSETVTVGSNAPPGATAIIVDVIPGSVPAGYSISVPAVIPVPAPGTTSTFNIDVTFPATPTADADWTIQYRFDNRPTLFSEYSITAQGVPDVPTVSEWGLMIFLLLLLTGGTLVIRRRSALAVAA